MGEELNHEYVPKRGPSGMEPLCVHEGLKGTRNDPATGICEGCIHAVEVRQVSLRMAKLVEGDHSLLWR